MTITVWPVDAVSGSPEYSGRKLRQTSVSAFGVMGNPARPLGVRSGVRPGTRSYTGAVSGTTWSILAHGGILDVEAAAEAGGYAYASDATVSGTIAASNASNPRYDLVYVQLSDPAEGDGTALPKVEILYVAGLPAPSPVIPATPARSIPLMRITQPQTGGGAATALWIAPYSAAAGAFVPFMSLDQLNAWTTPPPQQHASVIGDTDAKNGDYQYDGTKWVPQSQSGTDANGWTYVTLSNGKRMFTRELSAWSPGDSFGPQGGTNWVQTRVNGLLPPAGLDFSAFMVNVSAYPQSTGLNSLQALLIAYLSATSGTAAVSVLVANPTAATISNSNMNLRIAIQLIEK